MIRIRTFFITAMLIILICFEQVLAENAQVKIPKNTLQIVASQAQKLASNINIKNKIIPQLENYLQKNSQVYGASFTFAPVQKNQVLVKYAPYVYRQGEKLKSIDLAKSYDYTQQSWYTRPVLLKKGVWSKPYFDEGGGNAWMVTYSIPVYADPKKTKLVGVVTNDVLISR